MKLPILSARPLVVTMFALMSVACDATNPLPSKSRQTMTNLPVRLQAVFAKTKPICIGRIVVDVPISAEVIYGPAHVQYPIQRYPGEAARIAEKLSTRLVEIQGQRRYAEEPLLGKDSLLGKTLDGAVAGQTIVYGVSKSTGIFYRIESFQAIGEDLFVQHAEASATRNESPTVVQALNMVATNLRLRLPDEIPDEPGICIEGAFVAEPASPIYEWVTLGVRLKEFPDVHFSLSLTKKNVLVASDALEPRLAESAEEAKRQGLGTWFARIKTLRQGVRQLGRWNGFEALVRKPAHDNQPLSHEFAYMSQGEPKNPLIPVLDIRMDTGVVDDRTAAVRPSVTDEEAVAIWDWLTNGIKVRSTVDRKGSVDAPNEVSVDSLALAGDTCVQSGWWRCTDGVGEGLEVAGGRRQYFRLGQRMPQAILLRQTSLWQKIRGERETIESSIPSSWRLEVKADGDSPQGEI